MYVKCINQRGDGDRIYEAGDNVELGSVPWWLKNQSGPPHEAHLNELTERLGFAADIYDRTLIHEEPFGYKDGNKDDPFWKLRWVRFDHPEGMKAVVCTGPIYVLSDSGKTIDRTP